MIRYLLIACGCISLLLGIIGIFAAVADHAVRTALRRLLGKGIPALYRWLHLHRYFGPMVHNWEQNGAVPRKAKIFAISMMTASCLIMFWQFPNAGGSGRFHRFLFPCRHMDVAQARILNAVLKGIRANKRGQTCFIANIC